MKKILLTVIVLVYICSLAVPAMAATVKVPKSMCLNIQNTMWYLTLATKPGGSVKMQDGTMKFYDIQGSFFYGNIFLPVAGSGYVKNDMFHFTIQAGVYDGVHVWNFSAEGGWNLTTATGGMYAVFLRPGNAYEEFWTLQQISCSDVTILTSEPSSGAGLEAELEKMQ